MYSGLVKPFFDFTASLVLLILTFPFWFTVWVLLIIVNKGNAFFIQERPGKDERIFKIIKFKTMTDARDSEGKLLPDKDRLTMVGKVVRKLSFDELPQLFNVLKGDLSLIGPRPLLVEYLPLYNETQKRRHEVKPGISGWAQVNGRNALTWEQKFDYDIYYVNNISFGLDLKILFLTIFKILRLEGISAEGEATMTKFKGNSIRKW